MATAFHPVYNPSSMMFDQPLTSDGVAPIDTAATRGHQQKQDVSCAAPWNILFG